MQKMKFCVNVHMRILTHMLKKGVWGNSPASGNWAPSCDACYPRKRRFPGACFSLLRQAAQNKKVPSGTIFWRRIDILRVPAELPIKKQVASIGFWQPESP